MEAKTKGTAQHPFQCLSVAHPPGAAQPFLLAACGPRLVSTSLGEDATIHEWSAAPAVSTVGDANEGSEERPAKKQKTGPAPSAASRIIKLTVTPANQYVIVVTEDKVVRVLEIAADGSLLELSQRTMPKRPCAIDVLPDNATIMCGDKFGDVYSLPLLPNPESDTQEATAGAEGEQTEKAAPAFKPSATNTTVHTKRNRKALEAQLKQKNLTAKTKEPLKFEHKLLLGHVSMLTDVVHATREVDGKQRSYIITADRDEHIRVSRGPPQSHVIEGYCLGHTEYVSKICLVPGTDLLVSGGGDSWIGIWDWPSFKLKRKIDILDTLREGLRKPSTRWSASDFAVENINVSGIWVLPMHVGPSQIEQAVVVACEGYPALLVCPIADLDSASPAFTPFTHFAGPVLDVATWGEASIASLDDRREHQACRAMSFKPAKIGDTSMGYLSEKQAAKTTARLNALAADIEDPRALDGLLYGVANLRKRGHQSGEQGSDAEGGPVDEGSAAPVEAGD